MAGRLNDRKFLTLALLGQGLTKEMGARCSGASNLKPYQLELYYYIACSMIRKQ